MAVSQDLVKELSGSGRALSAQVELQEVLSLGMSWRYDQQGLGGVLRNGQDDHVRVVLGERTDSQASAPACR